MSEYPLKTALALRAQDVLEAQQAVTAATEAVERAEHALLEGQAHLLRYNQETASIDAEERARDMRGRTAREMLHAQEYTMYRRREEAKLEEKVETVAKQLDALKSALEAQIHNLAVRRGELKAVEKHHARWKNAQRLLRERARDAENDDLTRARRR